MCAQEIAYELHGGRGSLRGDQGAKGSTGGEMPKTHTAVAGKRGNVAVLVQGQGAAELAQVLADGAYGGRAAFALLAGAADAGLGFADPIAILVAVTLLTIVAALAGFLPAWRASQVDPMIALRYE